MQMPNAQGSSNNKESIFRYLTFGFLGTLALGVLVFFVLAWKFTPLVDVDESAGRVRLLGGLIQVQDKPKRVTDEELRGVKYELWPFEGAKQISPKNIIEVPFANGRLSISNSPDRQFVWKCKIGGENNTVPLIEEAGMFVLSLNKAPGASCELKVPNDVQLSISGDNGKIDVHQPRYHLHVKMENGKVDVRPDSGLKYKFNAQVQRGMVDRFDSSVEADAYQINVSLVNGMVSRL